MQDLASPHADQFAVVLSRFPSDLDLDRLALEHKALEQIAPVISDSNGPDVAALFGEESERLASTLRRLPYEQHEILLLRLYSGMRFRTIAELKGESINTIQGQYRYGLNKLRSLLNSEVKK